MIIIILIVLLLLKFLVSFLSALWANRDQRPCVAPVFLFSWGAALRLHSTRNKLPPTHKRPNDQILVNICYPWLLSLLFFFPMPLPESSRSAKPNTRHSIPKIFESLLFSERSLQTPQRPAVTHSEFKSSLLGLGIEACQALETTAVQTFLV